MRQQLLNCMLENTEGVQVQESFCFDFYSLTVCAWNVLLPDQIASCFMCIIPNLAFDTIVSNIQGSTHRESFICNVSAWIRCCCTYDIKLYMEAFKTQTYLTDFHLCPKVMPSVVPIQEWTRMASASAPQIVTMMAALHVSLVILLKTNVPLQTTVVGGTAAVARPVCTAIGILLVTTSGGLQASTGTPGKAPLLTLSMPPGWWSSLYERSPTIPFLFILGSYTCWPINTT